MELESAYKVVKRERDELQARLENIVKNSTNYQPGNVGNWFPEWSETLLSHSQPEWLSLPQDSLTGGPMVGSGMGAKNFQ